MTEDENEELLHELGEFDALLDDFDWDSVEPKGDAIPIGSDIQRALRDECRMVSPYVKLEAGTETRFDLAMYLPDGMPFITDEPESYHCWHKFRRIYCRDIWRTAIKEYAIPDEERKQRREELKEKHKDERFYIPDVPQYRYNGKEYKYEEDFWRSKAKKDIALCDQPNCEWFKERQKDKKAKREEYGFMQGLHLFEIKSDKDKHDLLIHQIPNMIAIADYVWLVLGENQPKPEWLPPYISVLRYKDGKFTIEHYNEITIKQPPMYRHSFAVQGYKIENSEGYALTRLMRDWRINSMFHFMFEGQIVIDMQDDIEQLLSFLRRADKNKTKQDYEKFQKNLFNYEPEGSGKDGR